MFKVDLQYFGGRGSSSGKDPFGGTMASNSRLLNRYEEVLNNIGYASMGEATRELEGYIEEAGAYGLNKSEVNTLKGLVKKISNGTATANDLNEALSWLYDNDDDDDDF